MYYIFRLHLLWADERICADRSNRLVSRNSGRIPPTHYCPMVYGGGPIIRSLTLKSNIRTIGSFGVEKGMPFNFLANGSWIVGFYEGTGWFPNSIRFYLLPSKPTIFQRVEMKFTGFYPLANKDGEQQKTKGSRSYHWGKWVSLGYVYLCAFSWVRVMFSLAYFMFCTSSYLSVWYCNNF